MVLELILQLGSGPFHFFVRAFLPWCLRALLQLLIEPKKNRSKPILKKIPVSELLFDSFHASGKTMCVFHRFISGTQCNRSIKQADKDVAGNRRNAIAVCHPGDASMRGLLDSYAQLCLCSPHRQRVLEELSFWDEQIDSWLKEIQEVFYADAEEILIQLTIAGKEDVANQLEATLSVSLPLLRKQSCPGGFDRRKILSPAREDNEWVEFMESSQQSIEENYRSRFANNTKNTKMSCQLAEFTFFTPRPQVSIASLVEKRLGKAERDEGVVYIYRVIYRNRFEIDDTDSQYLKIGYTTVSAATRLKQWQGSCGLAIKLVQCFETPHAKRTEGLIQKELELAGKRRFNNRCTKNGPGGTTICRQKHDEWFEVREAEAIAVTVHWTKWMRTYRPYSNDGSLKKELLISMYRFAPNVQTNASIGDDSSSTQMGFLLDSQGKIWFGTTSVRCIQGPARSCDVLECKKTVDKDGHKPESKTITRTRVRAATVAGTRRRSTGALKTTQQQTIRRASANLERFDDSDEERDLSTGSADVEASETIPNSSSTRKAGGGTTWTRDKTAPTTTKTPDFTRNGLLWDRSPMTETREASSPSPRTLALCGGKLVANDSKVGRTQTLEIRPKRSVSARWTPTKISIGAGTIEDPFTISD